MKTQKDLLGTACNVMLVMVFILLAILVIVNLFPELKTLVY